MKTEKCGICGGSAEDVLRIEQYYLCKKCRILITAVLIDSLPDALSGLASVAEEHAEPMLKPVRPQS